LEKPKLYGAIEMGGTKCVCAVGLSAQELLATETFPTNSPTVTFACLIEFFRDTATQLGEISRIGIGSFGPVDINTHSSNYGSILQTPKPGWSNTSYFEQLAALDTPLTINTDVNAAALGEYLYGAHPVSSSLAYVTVGTGIGVGVVKDGAPLSGLSHYEMGRIRPPHDSARDPYKGCCRFHGDCLEGLASGPAIAERWGSLLSELDSSAIQLEAGYLAHLCQTIILTHMPERIMLGGGVMKTAGLLEQVRKSTAEQLAGYVNVKPITGDLNNYICSPGLGDRSGLVGALALAER